MTSVDHSESPRFPQSSTGLPVNVPKWMWELGVGLLSWGWEWPCLGPSTPCVDAVALVCRMSPASPDTHPCPVGPTLATLAEALAPRSALLLKCKAIPPSSPRAAFRFLPVFFSPCRAQRCRGEPMSGLGARRPISLWLWGIRFTHSFTKNCRTCLSHGNQCCRCLSSSNHQSLHTCARTHTHSIR